MSESLEKKTPQRMKKGVLLLTQTSSEKIDDFMSKRRAPQCMQTNMFLEKSESAKIDAVEIFLKNFFSYRV
jgi:hypothetical protein